MGQKIHLNETHLRKIISESVRQTLNEIGDTPEGRKMIGHILNKQKGNPTRREQFQNVETGLDDIYNKTFGDGYNDIFPLHNAVVYNNTKKAPIAIKIKDGYCIVRLVGMPFKPLMEILNDRDLAGQIGAANRGVARKIAKWCSEKVSPESEDFQVATDWHTWVA